DIDHQFERLFRAAGNATAAHVFSEREHALTLVHDDFFDFSPADSRTGRLPQSDVKHGAILGRVDLVAAPHGLDTSAHPHCFNELDQLVEDDLVESLAREVH